MKQLISLLVLFSPLLAHAQDTLLDNLIIDLPFNGNAFDETGNITSPIQVNGAFLCEDRNGQSNSAYIFDGLDDYIRVPHDSILNFQGSFSTSYWVRLSNDIVNEQERIIGKGLAHTGAIQNWSFTFKSDQQMDFFWEPLDDTNMLNTSDEILDSQKYYHIVGLIDTLNQESRLYINGNLALSNPSFGYSPAINSYDLLIGVRENFQLGGGFDNYFDGVIDDIKIFNKALNNCEVLSLYHEGTMSYPNLTTLEIIQSGTNFSSNLYGSSYQWYYNGIEMIGESNQSITVLEEGNYQVQVTNGNCTSELSEMVYFLSTETTQTPQFTIYPNPSTHSIKILASTHKINTATVKSIEGKTILNSTSRTIEFENKLKPGVYILEIDYDKQLKSYQRFIVE